MNTNTTLPTLFVSDDRLIRGQFLRCVDGFWQNRDGVALPAGMRLLALHTARALQRWEDKRPTQTIIESEGSPLPDLDALNAEIPESQWEIGLDGNPRPPWSKQYVAYFLDIDDAGLYTYGNATIGARIAVLELEEKLRWMKVLRGENCLPLIKLACCPMKTRFGVQQRPSFPVIEWRRISGGGAATLQLADRTNLQPVEPIGLAEEQAGRLQLEQVQVDQGRHNSKRRDLARRLAASPDLAGQGFCPPAS
jgi:hypothetical protein